MSWFVDHANIVYLLLGILALGFVVAWWMNKRVKFLAYAGAVVLLIGAFWLLTNVLPSDQREIQHTVETMADAVVRGDHDELFKHVARDFRYKEMTREQLAAVLKGVAAQHKIGEVKIWEFEVDEVSPDRRLAKAHFKATAFDAEGSPIAMVFCIATFTRENEQWKLKTIDFRNAANPDQPISGAP